LGAAFATAPPSATTWSTAVDLLVQSGVDPRPTRRLAAQVESESLFTDPRIGSIELEAAVDELASELATHLDQDERWMV
jgi:hypothetical protein